MNVLEEWLARSVEVLGLGDRWTSEQRDLVLDLARDVAHGVARPAAPLSTYVAGIAVGAGGDPAAVIGRLRALAEAWGADPAGGAGQPRGQLPSTASGVAPGDMPAS